MKSNQTALVILGVAAVWYLSSRNRTTQPAQPFVPYQSYIPPQPPPSNAQAWSQWVNAIVGSYGAVASLWQPGGPFFQQPVTQQQALQIANNFSTGFQSFP